MKRLMAVAAAFVASLLFISLIPATSAATIQATYQARYGSYGTITVREFTDGTGSAVVHLYALVPGRTYAFRLASGRCTGSITPLIPVLTYTVSSAGTIGRTRLLSSSQMGTIAPRLASADVVAVLTSGASRLCRTLYVPSAFGPSPSPSATPAPTSGVFPSPGATSTPGISANLSTHNASYGLTQTPASMTDWFAELKVGVPATATATVTAGENVNALLVIPEGGSIIFKITTSSGVGGWDWQWDTVRTVWDTPVQYFYEGEVISRTAGTWAFGLDSNVFVGSETLTLTPLSITGP